MRLLQIITCAARVWGWRRMHSRDTRSVAFIFLVCQSHTYTLVPPEKFANPFLFPLPTTIGLVCRRLGVARRRRIDRARATLSTPQPPPRAPLQRGRRRRHRRRRRRHSLNVYEWPLFFRRAPRATRRAPLEPPIDNWSRSRFSPLSPTDTHSLSMSQCDEATHTLVFIVAGATARARASLVFFLVQPLF
jgi:hypothetical protein